MARSAIGLLITSGETDDKNKEADCPP